LRAGRPQQKGNKRGAAYAYNVKPLRDQEIASAAQAQHAYEVLVENWQQKPCEDRVRGRLKPAGQE
jgi:hypothetical protein